MPDPNDHQVQCTACGAVYDVSGIEPGSSFPCEACDATVIVPGPPPRPARTRPEPSRTSRRDRAAAPDPEPSRSGGPVRWLVLAGSAVVLAVVVILIVTRGNNGRSASPDKGPVADTGSGAESRVETESEHKAGQQYRTLRSRAESTGDPDDWFALATWCDENRYQEDQDRARKLYRYIIRKLDPDHAGARARLGYHRYEGPIQKYAQLEWLTDEQLAGARELEAEERRRQERLTADPWQRAAEEIISDLKNDSALQKFDLEYTKMKPFVIAKEKKNPSTDEYKNRILGEMLQAAARDFTTTFASLGLKPIEDVEFKGRSSVLPIIYFEDKYSFDRYHLEKGQELPKGAAAYFMPSNNRIVYFEGTGRGSEKFNINKLIHELTHQLVWFYTPSRARCQLHFFQEGIAEFFSGTTRKRRDDSPDDKLSYDYTFRGKLQGRMKHLKHCRLSNWFTFEELLTIPDKMALDRICRQKAGDDENERARCGSLFYAEAWSLFYFIWHHEDGKYRPNLIRYAGMELEGKTGLRYLRKAFEEVNLKEIGRKWRDFVNSSGPFLKDV